MYRHVQLHDQTVSRKHAIMELVEGEWTLTNLSTTNPVVHNERLLGENETQTLSDGDRIEMGEVVFRYRVR
jgi:pSer/pThr/pTyr-binding forkhead associated (FHA) protein